MADVAVRRFHDQLNREDYEAIYQESGEGITRAGQSSDLAKMLQVIHRKLGDAGAASFVNIQVNATTNGTLVTTVYNTSFGQGSAIETFVWEKNGNSLKLFKYHIESKRLLE